MWKGHGQKPSDTLYLFFSQRDGEPASAVMLAPSDKNGGWAQYAFQTATLGPNKFMNAREVSSDGKPIDGAEAQKTFPVLYRVNGDGALVIYLMDETRAASAIKSGKIAGTVEPGNDGDVIITADAATLDAFMQTSDGRALFVKPLAILKKEK
jgi:hypothetical protein